MYAEPQHLLVVEENAGVTPGIERLVAQNLPGCQIVKASGIDEALHALRTEPIDGCVAHLDGPEADGIALCKLANADPETQHIPISLTATSKSPAARRAEALEQGADDVLVFPIEGIEAAARIRAMLRKKRAEDDLRRLNKQLEHIVDREMAALQTLERRSLALEEDVEKASQRFVSIVESSNDAILAVDARGNVQAWNRAAERVFGYSAEEAVGGSAVRLFLSPEADAATAWAQGGAGWEPVVDRDTRCVRKDGVEIDVSITASPLLNAQGNVVGASAIIRDTTERRRAEKKRVELERRLQQAQRLEAIGTLAGGIAHDFNNILGTILGHAELLREDLGPEDKGRSNVEKIVAASERAAKLVTQILTFSRQSDTRRHPLHMHLIVNETLELIRSSLPTTIDIVQDIDPACGAVLAGPTEIHQVMMNLCTNAYHAMRDTGGVLTVRLRPTDCCTADALDPQYGIVGPCVVLEVSDTGRGMDAVTRERIFDPFYTTKMQGEGTGMGLSAVHGIVRECGGAVHVRSHLNKGTTFNILLPVCQSEQAPRPGTEEAAMEGRGETVLFVDDEEELVHVAQRTMERLGYRIAGYTSSAEALEAFRADPVAFDIVVTDLNMPEMTGIALAEKIRAIHPNTPMLLCTGFREKITEAEAERLGFSGYLLKPIIVRKMARAIREALDHSPAVK